ncbi:VOC family protein [Streptomyces ficellus]|uniref:VOC family protein n=1 Tax=Streptomyces ficellus TaxID=1977088 RepID=A0A6I6FCV0_9ACTN|nr:VOC family protein [Streptomyces ficellus]QGV80944.1 VOC family protein [Streptomyces ficellus]
MNWTLEVVLVPATDLDRAKDFYGTKCGFTVDLDTEVAPGLRIIQLTPPGSRCSITLQSGMPGAPGEKLMTPGSLHGLQLCVTDIEAAREQLVSRGVEVSPVQHVGEKGWEEGKGETWNSFMFFKDPDGNGWTVQEAPSELSER